MADNNIYQSTFYEASAAQRKAIRFIRKDIEVFISNYGLFNRGESLKVKLLDISSSGVKISIAKKSSPTRLKGPLCLTLNFADGKVFAIDSKIARHEVIVYHHYKLLFEIKKFSERCKTVRLSKVSLFEGNQQINAKYRNLTQRTIDVLTKANFDKYSAVYLVFTFSDGEQLKSYARPVNRSESVYHQYGIQFNHRNEALGEYLLATQTELSFADVIL
ncbi:MAG: hypothetical protein ACU837_14845 [Gammaproteobacteria bacterium]